MLEMLMDVVETASFIKDIVLMGLSFTVRKNISLRLTVFMLALNPSVIFILFHFAGREC